MNEPQPIANTEHIHTWILLPMALALLLILVLAPEWVVAGTTPAEIPLAISSQLQHNHQINNNLQLTFTLNDKTLFATT